MPKFWHSGIRFLDSEPYMTIAGHRRPGAATLLTYRLDEEFTGFEPQS